MLSVHQVQGYVDSEVCGISPDIKVTHERFQILLLRCNRKNVFAVTRHGALFIFNGEFVQLRSDTIKISCQLRRWNIFTDSPGDGSAPEQLQLCSDTLMKRRLFLYW